MRHLVRYAADAEYLPDGDLRRWSIVDETTPAAVHTGFGVCQLPPGGSVPARVQSFEECFYVLGGSVVLRSPEGATLLRPGDYGLLPVGVPHSWSNDGDEAARWAYMLSPQPRSRYGGDTFAVPPVAAGAEPAEVDVRDPRTRSFGHIEPVNMLVDKQTQDMLAVSASMRTALLVYSGITVKMMVDSDLGAQLTTMFMVQYEPQGVAGPHDHPFEETYLFLEGEVEATFDGESYRLGAGDVAWAGVGCVHGFRNVGTGVVRWLETQAPQPPGRHSYRFVRDWDYLESRL
ncbi:MAG: cupin domain-containing protein [Micromonosporaceae bacterium]|nr:cupin domain-containing protein [Micromonosporaceae bacterium]